MNEVLQAKVVRVEEVLLHPNADRLVILRLSNGVEVVSGPHYEPGQLGVYIPAGLYVPGWLAEELWLVKTAREWVAVEERNMRGVQSAGLFCGQRWRNTPESPWQAWDTWRRWWELGEDVTASLGLTPHAH